MGYFTMVDEKNPHKNWHKPSFYYDMHNPRKVHPKLCVIGDYPMFFKQKSDIAYMATEEM